MVDAQISELTQASANIVALERVFAQYGPETREVREIHLLKSAK